MKTKITELLGIKYPVIQGGMAWTSDANLAAAVSNAGGAGIIATGGRTTEWTKAEIQKCKTLTDKPFGVNLMLMAPNVNEIIEVVCEEKVAFVTLGAGNPVPHIEKLHSAGIKVIPVVPNVKLAKRVEAAGVDAMVIEGMEGGGHIGQQTTMALMTNVLPLVKNVPVLVAGGIADGRGIAAALLMVKTVYRWVPVLFLPPNARLIRVLNRQLLMLPTPIPLLPASAATTQYAV